MGIDQYRYVLVLDVPGGRFDVPDVRFAVAEGSSIEELRGYIPTRPSLMGQVETFTFVRLKAGQMASDPTEYDLPGFAGEIIKKVVLSGPAVFPFPIRPA